MWEKVGEYWNWGVWMKKTEEETVYTATPPGEEAPEGWWLYHLESVIDGIREGSF